MLGKVCWNVGDAKFRQNASQTNGERSMPTYVQLANLTNNGLGHMMNADPEEWFTPTKEGVQSFDGRIKNVYLTMGQYDAVVVSEFPSDEAASQATLSVLQKGVVETETLRAFTEDEVSDMMAEMRE